MMTSRLIWCCAGLAVLAAGSMYLAGKNATQEPQDVAMRACGCLVGLPGGNAGNAGQSECPLPVAPVPAEEEPEVPMATTPVDPVVAVAGDSLPGHIIIEEPAPMNDGCTWLVQMFEDAAATLQYQLSFGEPMATLPPQTAFMPYCTDDEPGRPQLMPHADEDCERLLCTPMTSAVEDAELLPVAPTLCDAEVLPVAPKDCDQEPSTDDKTAPTEQVIEEPMSATEPNAPADDVHHQPMDHYHHHHPHCTRYDMPCYAYPARTYEYPKVEQPSDSEENAGWLIKFAGEWLSSTMTWGLGWSETQHECCDLSMRQKLIVRQMLSHVMDVMNYCCSPCDMGSEEEQDSEPHPQVDTMEFRPSDYGLETGQANWPTWF